MIKFSFYNRKYKRSILWKKKLDKNLPGSVIPCYGCFIRGWILTTSMNWEEVIINKKESYDLEKQYRKSREKFLLNSYYGGIDLEVNPHIAFDTKEDAAEYFGTHKKINYRDFHRMMRDGTGKFLKSRMYILAYKSGFEYVTI